MFNNNEPKGEAKPMEYKKKIWTIVILAVILVIVIVILLIIFLSNKKEEEKPYNPIPDKEDLDFTEEGHRTFEREVATQTMVLATNNGKLPLGQNDMVVLFGLGTVNTIYGGWGSGEVYNKGTSSGVTPIKVLEGIEKKFEEKKIKYKKNEIGYEIGQGIDPTVKNLTDADVQELSTKVDGATRSIAVFTISRRSGEGSDRPRDASDSGTLLSQSEIDTFNSIKKYFDNIIIVLNVGSVIELNDLEKDDKTSILIAYLPGMEAGNSIADILVGDANPSGHLTDTWAKTINDYPTTSTFIESPLYVKYKEGLFIGYRYFEEDEEKQSKVIFPFGHGLSYTTFKSENSCSFNSKEKTFTVTSKVTNTGQKSGKHVIQVYAQKQQNEEFVKVKRELVAFGKTKELKPGEEETLTMSFDLYYLSSYDETGVTGNRACYVLEKGEYKLFVADSVAATRSDQNLIYTHKQEELLIIEKLQNRIIPHDPEVANANKRPDFKALFNTNFEKVETVNKGNNNPVSEEQHYLKSDPNEGYSNIPTDKINTINFKSVLEKKYTMEQLVETMTNEELAYLSYGKTGTIKSGTGVIGGDYNSGLTGKYNIPYGDTNDGPAGLRQSEVKMGSTAWPCSTALASSFDVNLIKKVGEETGKEARRIGCSFWLAPGMNIHRSPLCGRNFEYYSEDPILTGKMAAALTQGVQSKRVSITIKHFCVNNKEENRNGGGSTLASDSRLAERVAREIYLRGFEIAVKEGDAWSIMSSYNRINSMKTSESFDLLTGILRNEWKFKGLVMTDWGNTSKNDREAHAGNSVKMPNNGDGTKTILDGLVQGTVTRSDLKRDVLYTLNTLSKTACIDTLFKEPTNKLKIIDGYMKVKIYDYIYRKTGGIYYEECQDEDGGYNPTNTNSNRWISIYVENDKEQERLVKLRYSSRLDGFGVAFNRYDENLGEITNLDTTGDWQKWNTTNPFVVKFPKGKYELTIRILGYDYSSENASKGNINYLEIL